MGRHATLPREYFLPRPEVNAQVIELEESVLYLWQEKGYYRIISFSGKRAKPDNNYKFTTEKGQQDFITRWKDGITKHAAYKNDEKEKKKAAKADLNAATDLPVNTIMVESWGYDQTQVDFYKVIGHFGKFGVTLVPIGAKRDETRPLGGSMSDHCLPDDTGTPGEPLNGRQASKEYVNVSNKHGTRKSSLHKWDGRPCYRSWYA